MPEGFVTGVDVNDNILPRARTVARSTGVTNIEFQPANVYSLPFDDVTFDIVHCHQMLCHSQEPIKALREMLRVTKVGGLIAAREGDFGTECIWPELPGLVKYHKVIARMIESPTAGRRLLPWAMEAGVERKQIDVSFSTWYYAEQAEKDIWAQAMIKSVQNGKLREKAIAAGITSESDLEEMMQAWEQWCGQDNATVAMMHREILIQK